MLFRRLVRRPVVAGDQVSFVIDQQESCAAIFQLAREIFPAAYVMELDRLLVRLRRQYIKGGLGQAGWTDEYAGILQGRGVSWQKYPPSSSRSDKYLRLACRF